MGITLNKVNKKGNRVVEEVLTEKGAKCSFCTKWIPKGKKAIKIIRPNGTTRIRFCSSNCRDESELVGYRMQQHEP